MKSIINWKKLWHDFEEWINKKEDTPGCKICGSSSRSFPDWDEQQDKIQRLANAQVRKHK